MRQPHDDDAGVALRPNAKLQDAAATHTPPPSPPAYMFGEVTADSVRHLRLRAVLGPCNDGGCSVDMQLLQGERLLQGHPLEWRTSPGTPTLATLDPTLGVGDPLSPDLTSQAASIGQESAAITIFAQSVRLGPFGNGLLVHQAAGYEHVKRRRQLFVAEGSTLGKAWSYDEAQGPEWTTVEVVDLDNDGIDELRMWTFSGSDELLVESVQLETFAWNAERQRFQAQTNVAPLISTLVIQDFASEQAARAAFMKRSPNCPEWRLFGSKALGLAPPKSWIGVVTAHPEIAQRALDHAKECAPKAKVRLKERVLTRTGPS